MPLQHLKQYAFTTFKTVCRVLLENISMISLLLKRLAREHIYDKSTIKASC
jgi:hypothetical protein